MFVVQLKIGHRKVCSYFISKFPCILKIVHVKFEKFSHILNKRPCTFLTHLEKCSWIFQIKQEKHT